MRKLLIAVAVLAGLVGLVLPGLIGLLLSAMLKPPDVGNPPTLEVRSLVRGWFVTDLELLVQRGDDAPLVVAGRARHGPWGFAWLRGSGEVLAPGNQRASVADVEVRIGLAGILEGRLVPSPELGRGQLTITATDGWENWAFVPGSLDIDGVVQDLNGVATLRAGGLLSGELTAGRLPLASGSALDGARLRFDVEHAGEALALDLAGSADALSTGEGRWRALCLDLELRRLHAPTLERLVRALGQVPAEQAGAMVVTALGPLLLFSPVVEQLAVAGRSPADGAFRAHLSGRFIAPPPPGFIGDFARLLRVLELEGELRADSGLARSWVAAALSDPLADPGLEVPVEEHLRQLVADGVLVPDEQGYRLAVDYEPGRLLLNGRFRPVPIDVAP